MATSLSTKHTKYDSLDVCLCSACAPDYSPPPPPPPPQCPPMPTPALTVMNTRVSQPSIQAPLLQQQLAPTPTIPFPWFPFPSTFYCMPPMPPAVPALPQACCVKYSMWLTQRVGWPPHDYHCDRQRSSDSDGRATI